MNYLNKGLLDACKFKQSDKIHSIIKSNPRNAIINYIDKHGMTPILYACKNNLQTESFAIIDKFRNTCNINQTDNNNNSAILYAIKNNMTNVIILFLQTQPKLSVFPTTSHTSYNIIFQGHQCSTTLLEYLLINNKDAIVIKIMNALPQLCHFDNILSVDNNHIHHNILSIACAQKLFPIIDIIMTKFYDRLKISNISSPSTKSDICISIVLFFLKHNKIPYIRIMIENGDIQTLELNSIAQIFVLACEHNEEHLANDMLDLINTISDQNENEYHFDQQIILNVCNYGKQMDKVICKLLQKYPPENRIENKTVVQTMATDSPFFYMIKYLLFRSMYYYIVENVLVICKICFEYWNNLIGSEEYSKVEPNNNIISNNPKILITLNNFNNVCEYHLHKLSNNESSNDSGECYSENDSDNFNECIICCDNTEDMYVSIKCGHITRLCNGCYIEYKKLNTCSVCRKSLTLIKCYDT